jgi:2-haloacid dehalogenase
MPGGRPLLPGISSSSNVRGAMETVVFDIGGVLLDWDPRHLYRKLFDDESEMERFLAEICTPEWHDAHDRGESTEASCADLAAAHPEYAELIWAWARRSEEMIAGPIQGTVEILHELKAAGVPCYALTNMERETYPLRVERYPFMRVFDGAVVSGFEGIAKPDVEIFERLLSRFSLTADTTLLVDDSPRNVAAAASVGMQAVQFRSASELRQLLEEAELLGRVRV